MNYVSAKLTVYFEDPFYVGVFERVENNKLSVAKIVFGAEPKDYEVWEFILSNYYRLSFSPHIAVATKPEISNPKRRLRVVRRQCQDSGIGTKSQQALQKQREENKLKRKVITKDMKEVEKQRLFELRQQKKKEKHKGR